jgi:hypothetical protein
VTQFINVYEKIFNVIFDNGIMPSSWLIGMIKPNYKNKGDKFDPKNYRPITIVSCLGKLFTAILNERLNQRMRSTFFFFLHFRISKKDCKVNILSVVEYPWRKPDWF